MKNTMESRKFKKRFDHPDDLNINTDIIKNTMESWNFKKQFDHLDGLNWIPTI